MKNPVLGWAFVGLATYVALRAIDVLPREKRLRDEMDAAGKIQGLDWQWKQPCDWRETYFGLQEVEMLR